MAILTDAFPANERGLALGLNWVWQVERIEPFGPEPGRDERSRGIGRRLAEEIATGQAA